MNQTPVPRIRVAGACFNGTGELLVIAHEKEGRVYWLLPGGGVDYGETLEEALKREFMEELGLTIEVGDIVHVMDSIDPVGSRHVVNVHFKCDVLQGEPVLGESHRLYDVAFVGHEELSRLEFSPPVQDLLAELFKNANTTIYQGSRWKTF